MEATEVSATMTGGSSSKQDQGKSVFTLMSHLGGGLLYELKLDPSGLVMGGCGDVLHPVAKFFDESYGLLPFYSMDGVCIGSKFYLLISRLPDHYYDECDWGLPATEKLPPVNAFIFDLKNKELVKFSPSRADKPHGIVVYASKKIYFLLDVSCNPYLPKDSFERYDPSTDSWESLNPFPYTEEEDCAESFISGYLIYEGSIMFSIIGHQDYSVVAYYENRNCWEPVHVEDSRGLSWNGQAVVLDNTVYALKHESVIRFRVNMVQTDEGGVFFTLGKSSMDALEIKLPSCGLDYTLHMNHMGGKQFCIVKSGYTYTYDKHQSLSITTFQIEEGDKIKISDSTTHKLDNAAPNLEVVTCFSVQCEDVGRNGDDTTLMNQQNQEAEPTVKHVGVEDGSSSGSSELSTTQTGMVRSRWTVKIKAKTVTLYGLIPLVIIMGIKVSKLALTQLLKHD